MSPAFILVSFSVYSSALKTQATCSSETSVSVNGLHGSLSRDRVSSCFTVLLPFLLILYSFFFLPSPYFANFYCSTSVSTLLHLIFFTPFFNFLSLLVLLHLFSLPSSFPIVTFLFFLLFLFYILRPSTPFLSSTSPTLIPLALSSPFFLLLFIVPLP